jgi:hypothetical protein
MPGEDFLDYTKEVVRQALARGQLGPTLDAADLKLPITVCCLSDLNPLGKVVGRAPTPYGSASSTLLGIGELVCDRREPVFYEAISRYRFDGPEQSDVGHASAGPGLNLLATRTSN